MTVRQGRLRPGPEMNGDFWVCVIPETGLNDQEVKRFRQPCFDLLCQFFPGGGFQIVEGAGTSLSGHCGQRSQQIGDLIAQSFCITNPGCQEIRNPSAPAAGSRPSRPERMMVSSRLSRRTRSSFAHKFDGLLLMPVTQLTRLSHKFQQRVWQDPRSIRRGSALQCVTAPNRSRTQPRRAGGL